MQSYECHVTSVTNRVIDLLETKYQTLGALLENEDICRHDAVFVLNYLCEDVDIDNLPADQAVEVLRDALVVYGTVARVLG